MRLRVKRMIRKKTNSTEGLLRGPFLMSDRKCQTDTAAIIWDILLHIETDLSIPSSQCSEGGGSVRF